MPLARKFLGVLLALAVFGAGWLIRQDLAQPPPADPSVKPSFRLEDVTRELGITFRYHDPVLDPRIQGKLRLLFVGAGVAVADFNGDGWMDILLVDSKRGGRNHLYLNREGTHFEEQAEAWGIADTNSAGANVNPVVFDYDNDGRPDVYLARMGCSMLFHNTGTRFENVSKSSGLGDCRNAFTAVPLDYDNDGRLDLLVLRYWREFDYFHLPTPVPLIWRDSENFSRNGGGVTLYRNLGNGAFKDVTAEAAPRTGGWSLDGTAADFSDSGSPMIYVSNDFGPDDLLKVREGGLSDVWSRHFKIPDRRQGMGVSLGDLEHDGRPSVYVSNENLMAYEPLHGNYLFTFSENRPAVDKAQERGVSYCGGWSWGAAFADLDLDGQQDLFVNSGFITGEPGKGDYTFDAGVFAAVPGVSFNLLDWPDIKGRSFIGQRRSCVFLNRTGHFENVTERVGVTESWDGRAAALIDFDNNGSLDLIVTTQNGPPHLLKNTVVPGRHWIRFSLVGTRSNRDGAGARLELRQKGRPPQYRWATAGRTGFMASSDPRLHFGLPSEEPSDLLVRWPSGRDQLVTGLEPGKTHVIREP